MKDKVFVDTNLWIYLYSEDKKSVIVRKLINESFSKIVLSTQILNEMFNVLTKKSIKSSFEAKEIIDNFINFFEIRDLNFPLTIKAINIFIRYHYSFWDSLIIASALEAGCSILYTEDMQHNQIIDGTLKIVNPFL